MNLQKSKLKFLVYFVFFGGFSFFFMKSNDLICCADVVSDGMRDSCCSANYFDANSSSFMDRRDEILKLSSISTENFTDADISKLRDIMKAILSQRECYFLGVDYDYLTEMYNTLNSKVCEIEKHLSNKSVVSSVTEPEKKVDESIPPTAVMENSSSFVPTNLFVDKDSEKSVGYMDPVADLSETFAGKPVLSSANMVEKFPVLTDFGVKKTSDELSSLQKKYSSVNDFGQTNVVSKGLNDSFTVKDNYSLQTQENVKLQPESSLTNSNVLRDGVSYDEVVKRDFASSVNQQIESQESAQKERNLKVSNEYRNLSGEKHPAAFSQMNHFPMILNKEVGFSTKVDDVKEENQQITILNNSDFNEGSELLELETEEIRIKILKRFFLQIVKFLKQISVIAYRNDHIIFTQGFKKILAKNEHAIETNKLTSLDSCSKFVQNMINRLSFAKKRFIGSIIGRRIASFLNSRVLPMFREGGLYSEMLDELKKNGIESKALSSVNLNYYDSRITKMVQKCNVILKDFSTFFNNIKKEKKKRKVKKKHNLKKST